MSSGITVRICKLGSKICGRLAEGMMLARSEGW
jgi:hypothetical protein